MSRIFTPEENKLIGENCILELQGRTWEQKASALANLNGKLMKANEDLRKEVMLYRRLLNNSEVMNEFYKDKIDKLEKLVYSN